MSNRPFSIVARNAQGIAKAQRILSSWKVSDDTPIEIVVRPYKRNRSQEQNKLYWMWLNVISSELGMLPEELAEDMKRKFLKPLLEAEDEGFRDILDKLRKAYRDGHHELAVSMEQHVMREASTSMLTTKQMTQYLERILDHATGMGITLPIPEDRRRL